MTTEMATQTKPATALKGGLFTLTAIQIFRFDLTAIADELESKIQQAPNFFQNAPIVIDLQKSEAFSKQNLLDLIQLFRLKKLIPVGVRGAQATQKATCIEAGLAILSETTRPERQTKTPTEKLPKAQQDPIQQSKPSPVPAEQVAAQAATGSRLITTPVRSGQQVYAPGGDLVILSAVSQGAELLAEGHIHVHGALRGRALAGINGDKNAIIYCKSLEAELVSIAGQYKIIEDLKESHLWKRSVCIKLVDDRLEVEAL